MIADIHIDIITIKITTCIVIISIIITIIIIVIIINMDVSDHRIVVDTKSAEMEVEESLSMIQPQTLPLPITLPLSLTIPTRSQRHRPSCLIPQPTSHNMMNNSSTSSEFDNQFICINENYKGTVTQSLNEINYLKI